MKKLIEGLHKFQTGYFSSHKELFEQLSLGQHPRILFITCSDSRIDPNLITNAEIGELFVIRNAGNIIPPFNATNGGEGAAVEYAIAALGIEQVIVCGHSHCGAMKGLLKMSKLEKQMPLVHNWLKQAEATRRLIEDNYSHLEGEELLDITIAENVLNQLENLHTYPIIRSRLHQNKLALHGWIYCIETGTVLAYDSVLHEFVAPHSRLPAPEYEYNLHPTCPVPHQSPFKVQADQVEDTTESLDISTTSTNLPGLDRLSLEQAERIYRGSTTNSR
jgi:carbonic anhydrase